VGKKKITKRDRRFGRKIRRLRKKAGLTQEQLAEKMGLSIPSIGYIEMGKHFPKPKNLYKIAKALGVKVGELFPF